MLVGPHDNEVDVALVRDAYKRFRRGPSRDFRSPVAIGGGWHEVVELGQGFRIVVTEHHQRLECYGGSEVRPQSRITPGLCAWKPGRSNYISLLGVKYCGGAGYTPSV
jgi:hypothetical protein